MKLFHITFGGRFSPESPHASGGHRDGWFTIEAENETQAREAAAVVTDGGHYAGFYPAGSLEPHFFPAGELKRFKASDILNPPDSTAPLTTEQLCRNLLAIKPGDRFEARGVSPGTSTEWSLFLPCGQTPLQAVRAGYDVRPLPLKRFVLLYHYISRPASTVLHECDQTVFSAKFLGGEVLMWFKAVLVESSSLSAAAALAAPQPGETFLAAVPYPEA